MAEPSAAVKTYRYLRIGMVGLVALLAVSVAFERADVSCWQTSISAYYYTPVRAILVGGLMAIGFSLIVIKGSTAWEDMFLNVAGMLAPVVALVPTASAGKCWSVTPNPLPINDDGSLAGWVIANIDNNVKALLITGIAGLIVAAVIASIATKDPLAVANVGEPGTRIGLLVAMALLVAGAVAYATWDGFKTEVHYISAIAMFVFLAAAVGSNALQNKTGTAKNAYFWWYLAIAVVMVVTGAVMLLFMRGWDYMVLVLEIVEITLFAVFWLVQTKEHWTETV